MRTGRPKPSLTLSQTERSELQEIVRRPTNPQAARRAGLILDCARGLDNRTVATLHQVTPLTVGKWRQRFLRDRIAGLNHTAFPVAHPATNAHHSRSVETRPAGGLQKRVTLQDLANHLNLHLSTISLGLKNDPRLIPATRLRIQEAARQLKYCPDPLAKALAVYRQAIRPASQHGSLALLAHPEDQISSLLETTRQRAAWFGYKVESVDCYSTRRSREQFTRLLRFRGIQGLIVLPPSFGRKNPRRLQIDWNHFPAVVLGHALYHPLLHQVSNDHLGNAGLLTRNLLSLGYRRIGLCLDEQFASLHAGGGWEGGYFGEMRRLKKVPRPFYRQTFEPDAATIQAAKRWIRKEQLDAVILDTDTAATLFDRHFQDCKPRLGIACLACYRDGPYSGINPQYDHVWSAAVDFLVHLIHTHQRGIPEIPQRVLLRGTWQAGASLHRMNR